MSSERFLEFLDQKGDLAAAAADGHAQLLRCLGSFFFGEKRVDRYEQGPNDRHQKRTEGQSNNRIEQGGYEPGDRTRHIVVRTECAMALMVSYGHDR